MADQYAQYIDDVAEDWPPLTDEQRERLALLLAGSSPVAPSADR